MKLDEIIQLRRSVRKFKDQSIDKEVIGEIIESARLAPSAVNFQPWKFYICRSEEAKKIMRQSYPREWFNSAPLYILACGDHQQSWKRPCDGKDHLDIDIAIAVEHMVLKITELGLGTCWVCNFNPQTVKEGLQLSENVEPIVLLPVGYPENVDPDPRNKKRKSPEEITKWI
ncbi:MAG TPA: nitroreductase [Porphyromonadaceae bacterium]|uniref:nitroreductase family protein n=1 Tax=Petrimonas sulfuriphila TaxID=285070 RepID=UPI000EEF8A04|nr:nitroreductase [Porphyromonadaceae bacterium]HMM16815.1 nitroreductase family protein [Petrimonas sp.]